MRRNMGIEYRDSRAEFIFHSDIPGAFQDVISLISDVRINLILPILIGIVLSVLLTARAINYLLEKHYSLIIQVILGIVISSTLAIIPQDSPLYPILYWE